MKKAVIIFSAILAAFVLLIEFARYEMRQFPWSTYIPGRDTVRYWNVGDCEIGRTASFYILRVNGETLDRAEDCVMAYKEIGSDVYFLTESGTKIVVDLENNTYVKYANDETYAEGFSDPSSFTWLEPFE